MTRRQLAIVSYVASGLACAVFTMYVIERNRCHLALEYVDVLGNLYFGIALIGLLFGCLHSASVFYQKRLAACRTLPVLIAIAVLALSVFIPAS